MFQEVLEETKAWHRSAEKMVEDFVEVTPFHGESFNFTEEAIKIEEDESKVRHANIDDAQLLHVHPKVNLMNIAVQITIGSRTQI